MQSLEEAISIYFDVVVHGLFASPDLISRARLCEDWGELGGLVFDVVQLLTGRRRANPRPSTPPPSERLSGTVPLVRFELPGVPPSLLPLALIG